MNKIATLIAATLAVSTVPASAGELTKITVKAGDLDLTKASDQERLETRVRSAIRSACRAGSRSLHAIQGEQLCRATLRDAADVEVRLAVAAAREQRLAVLAVSDQS